MSRDSYNHLKRYLLDKKHTVLLNIIQEHLFIDGKICSSLYWLEEKVFVFIQKDLMRYNFF